MAYRVVQWATGGVGREALRGILSDPRLELTGALVYDAQKHGKDAGLLCGLPPAGVLTTQDKEAIFALDADCVCYTPREHDLADVCRLLESGKNVVTTAFLFHPDSMASADLRRLETACQRGSSSVHGTGINPGFVGDELVLALSGLSRRIDHVKITERANWSRYGSPRITFDLVRFGHLPSETELRNHAHARVMSDLFLQSVGLVAQGIGMCVDGTRTLQQLELAEREFDLAGHTVRRGTVTGQWYRWQALRGGEPVIEVEALWTIGDRYPQQWPQPPPGWTVAVQGEPSMQLTFDFDRSSPKAATIATAMHAVHSIVPLCEAAPGVKTFLGLPLIAGAHTGIGTGLPWGRRFRH